MDCIFCKIISKEIPAEIIYEDEETVACLDANPLSKGHTLILPRVHVNTLLNLPDEKVGPFFLAVKKVAKLLEEKLKAEGFTLGINQGKASGQAIDHLHFHIIPRWKNDGGSSLHVVVHNPPKESLAEIKKLLTEKD